MTLADRLLAAVAARSGCLIPLVLILVVAAGGLAARTGRSAARAELTVPGGIDPASAAPGRIDGAGLPAAETVSPSAPGTPPPAASDAPPSAAASPPPSATPTPPPPPPRVRPTATPDPRQWRGRALTEVIIREEPKTDSRPAGLLLKEESAIVEATVPGEEVEKGNATWYWVRSGVMEGFVYSSLFEAGPRPAG